MWLLGPVVKINQTSNHGLHVLRLWIFNCCLRGVFQGQGRKVGLPLPDFQVPLPGTVPNVMATWFLLHHPAKTESPGTKPKEVWSGQVWIGALAIGSHPWKGCLVVDERLLSSGFGMLGASPPPGRHLWRGICQEHLKVRCFIIDANTCSTGRASPGARPLPCAE